MVHVQRLLARSRTPNLRKPYAQRTHGINKLSERTTREPARRGECLPIARGPRPQCTAHVLHKQADAHMFTDTRNMELHDAPQNARSTRMRIHSAEHGAPYTNIRARGIAIAHTHTEHALHTHGPHWYAHTNTLQTHTHTTVQLRSPKHMQQAQCHTATGFTHAATPIQWLHANARLQHLC